MLSSIAERQGLDKAVLLEELVRRKDVLHWMRERNIRSYKNVAAIIAEYYARPKHIYEKIISGEELKVASSQELEGWSFRLFGGVAPSVLSRFTQLKGMLEKARIKIYAETYVSLMLLITVCTIPVSLIATTLFILYGSCLCYF